MTFTFVLTSVRTFCFVQELRTVNAIVNDAEQPLVQLVSCCWLTVTMLDMNISQFLKSLGLEHLRDIFEREQVSGSERRGGG